MPLVRRRLSWIIRVWLICQVAGLAAAPFALCCASLASADQTPACCRGLSPGQTCPMHHGGEEDRTCKMRSACSRSDAALLTLADVNVWPAVHGGVMRKNTHATASQTAGGHTCGRIKTPLNTDRYETRTAAGLS